MLLQQGVLQTHPWPNHCIISSLTGTGRRVTQQSKLPHSHPRPSTFRLHRQADVALPCNWGKTQLLKGLSFLRERKSMGSPTTGWKLVVTYKRLRSGGTSFLETRGAGTWDLAHLFSKERHCTILRAGHSALRLTLLPGYSKEKTQAS